MARPRRGLRPLDRGPAPPPDQPEGIQSLHDRYITWVTMRVTPRQRWGLMVIASKRGCDVCDLVRPLVVDLLRREKLLTPEQCEPPAAPKGPDPSLQRKLF